MSTSSPAYQLNISTYLHKKNRKRVIGADIVSRVFLVLLHMLRFSHVFCPCFPSFKLLFKPKPRSQELRHTSRGNMKLLGENSEIDDPTRGFSQRKGAVKHYKIQTQNKKSPDLSRFLCFRVFKVYITTSPCCPFLTQTCKQKHLWLLMSDEDHPFFQSFLNSI